MPTLYAVDPGPVRSAVVLLDLDTLRPSPGSCIEDNEVTVRRFRHLTPGDGDRLAVEMIASYGMAVGREVFETCVWIGRYVEAWKGPNARLVYRRDVKLHLCGQARAKDPNVRAALLDRFGPGRERAIGTKKAPGPLYGFRDDLWAALGVAVTAAETRPS